MMFESTTGQHSLADRVLALEVRAGGFDEKYNSLQAQVSAVGKRAAEAHDQIGEVKRNADGAWKQANANHIKLQENDTYREEDRARLAEVEKQIAAIKANIGM